MQENEYMDPLTVNRAAVIVKVKQPYVDWANKLPDNSGLIVSAEHLNKTPHTYLIPTFDMSPDIEAFAEEMKPFIFENELNGWCTYEPWWPQNRTPQMFDDWFEISISELIFDLDEENELSNQD